MVTPLQNAMVAAAIANDGKLMQPTLVDRVRSADLSVISQTKPTVISHAFSADTANKLTQMMEAVVTKENTNLAINGVQVAVKTGTAQIETAIRPSTAGRSDSHRRTIRKSRWRSWCITWTCTARSRQDRL